MGFKRLDTRLDGPLLLEPQLFDDERGFFIETYRQSELSEFGVREVFVQDNHSRSFKGVVRGMHFQEGVSKLVHCARGEIWDVLVDLRRGSPTFGQWEGYTLSGDNKRVLYAPIGFAHGFCVLSDKADVIYKQSDYYCAKLEGGIAWDDPDVGIDWPERREDLISDRDAEAPRLAEVAADLPFVYDAG